MFGWPSGLPASANSGKVSEARTTANLAVKFHKILRLPPGEILPLVPQEAASWTANLQVKRDTPDIVYGSRAISKDESYYGVRAAEPPEVRSTQSFFGCAVK